MIKFFNENLDRVFTLSNVFQGFPLNGINIFASQLHTHGTGIKVSTKHYRDGVELTEVNRDDHYSTHFQEIRLLHSTQHILPVLTNLFQNRYYIIRK